MDHDTAEGPAAGRRDGRGYRYTPDATAEPPAEFARAAAAAVDRDCRVTGWSAAAEELLGYPAEDMIGRPLTSLLVHPPGGAGRPAPEERSGVVEVRHADGWPRRLGVRRWPVRADAGPPSGALVVAYDLTSAPWWEANRSLLERLLARSPVGISILDTRLRFVWANEELNRLGGVTSEQRIGRTFAEVQPLMDHVTVEAAMRRVLVTGAPEMDLEFTGRVRRDPRRAHATSATIFRLEDGAGRVQGICMMVVDATDRWLSKQRLALLSEAGERIGTTLDVRQTAQELADFGVPAMADLVVVDLLDAVLTGGEVAPLSADRSAVLRRAAHQSVRRGAPETVVRVGEESHYAPDSPMGHWLTDGRARLERVIGTSEDGWLRHDPDRAEQARRFGIHSQMIVPLRARNTTLGTVTFLRSVTADPFEEEDLEAAQAVVDRAALSLDNARRYTREHRTTLELQRSLLPRATTGAGVQCATRYFPADPEAGVGGDWFDVITLSGGRFALVVGDVVGHGLDAAAAMGRLRGAMLALVDMDMPPDELLAHLDDLVLTFIEDDPSADGRVANTLLGSTCLVAVLDPVAGHCALARAGHPPPLVLDPAGTARFLDLPAGPPLGLGAVPFEAVEVAMEPDSLMALYTDGLLARTDPDPVAAMERLRTALEQAPAGPEAACEAVVAVLGTGGEQDDAALLVARCPVVPADRVATFDVPQAPAAVAGIRAAVTRQLAAWGLSALDFSTELIVSELVTNALRHGRPPVRLRLIRHAVLTCEVADSSSTAPRLKHARTTDEGGRGLFLVAQLSRRWGTRHLGEGKVIWSEQELP
ncbi:SpoIIE family protein phosphatase [Kitasatospora sp. NPDC054939]